MTITVSWSGFMTKWFMIQKIYSKIDFTWCTKAHHNVITFKVDGMLYISHKWSMTFKWNKKILKWCIKHNFRCCYFLVEVTFHPLSHSFLHHFEIININTIYKLPLVRSDIVHREVPLLQKLLKPSEACPTHNKVNSRTLISAQLVKIKIKTATQDNWWCTSISTLTFHKLDK